MPELQTSRGRVRVDLIEAEVPDHPGWRAITLHNAATRRLVHDRAAAARSAVGARRRCWRTIKNPLSSIRGAAQLIADGADPADLTRLMIAEVDRITALIDHMEGFTDTRPRALEPLNIYPLLAHARHVALTGFARDIAIEERYDPSLSPRAGQRRRADAGAGQPPQERGARAGGDRRTAHHPRHRLSPRHHRRQGEGPAADRAADRDLRDRYRAGRAGRHRRSPLRPFRVEPAGKGLGLALVDKLIRDMGGIIQYSREGSPHVTVFRILLPRADA
ncbi:two-component sensor histidine kinase [Sphingomonas sp. MMS24-JH45]